MEKILFTVFLSVLVIYFSVQIRGNYGKAVQNLLFGRSNYTFHANSGSWPNWEKGRRACKETGSDLVSIESLKEWNFLKNTIQTMRTNEYSIGLRKDGKSGEWRWISDNSKVNTTKGIFPWAKDEPSGEGDCAVMYKDYRQDYGEYNDLSCTEVKAIGFICESHNENNGEDLPTVKGTPQTNGVNKEPATKPTTRQSSTVTLVTRLTLPKSPLTGANSEVPATAETTSQTNGGNKESATEAATTQFIADLSATLSTLSKSLSTGANSKATTPGNIVDDLPSEKTTSNKCNLILIILIPLAVLILIILITVCIISVRRHRKFKKQVLTGTNLTDQESSTLNPVNAARQLGSHWHEESKAGHGEGENPMRSREQSPEQEYGYAMLSPRTMMVPEDNSYASLVKSGAPARPLSERIGGPNDEAPTYVNQMLSSEYMNI